MTLLQHYIHVFMREKTGIVNIFTKYFFQEMEAELLLGVDVINPESAQVYPISGTG